MRCLVVVAVLGSGGVAGAQSPTPKTDIPSLEIMELAYGCTQEQAKKDTKLSEDYVAKLCVCGVDHERTRRIAKKPKAAILAEASVTTQCHAYAKAQQGAKKTANSPFSTKLHRSTDSLVGGFGGCIQGATTDNPPTPIEKARDICLCFVDAARASKLPIEKLASEPALEKCFAKK